MTRRRVPHLPAAGAAAIGAGLQHADRAVFPAQHRGRRRLHLLGRDPLVLGRRAEQLAPVAAEHLVLAERLRLAVDGFQPAPEADQRLVPGLGDFGGGRPPSATRAISSSTGPRPGDVAAVRHDGIEPGEPGIEARLRTACPRPSRPSASRPARDAAATNRPRRAPTSAAPARAPRIGAGAPCRPAQQRRLRLALDAQAALAELLGLPRAHRLRRLLARDRLEVAAREREDFVGRDVADDTSGAVVRRIVRPVVRLQVLDRQARMSDGQPIVGIWYGWATNAVACTCSIRMPDCVPRPRSAAPRTRRRARSRPPWDRTRDWHAVATRGRTRFERAARHPVLVDGDVVAGERVVGAALASITRSNSPARGARCR